MKRTASITTCCTRRKVGRRLKIRSIVGIIPLFAGEILEDEVVEKLPGFRKRMEWFLRYRPELADRISYCEHHDGNRQARSSALGNSLSRAARARLAIRPG